MIERLWGIKTGVFRCSEK